MSRAHTEKESFELAAFDVLVTRDIRQASDLSNRLAALGATVFEYPVIEITAPASSADLDRSLMQLATYEWIVFASTNAVDFFLNRMKALSIPSDKMSSLNLATVGARTAERLKARGLQVAFCPQEFSASAFAREFCSSQKTAGKKILWPRTNVGKLTIKELLEEHGAIVDAVIAYETHLPQHAIENIEKLESWISRISAVSQCKIITVTSSQAVRNLSLLLSKDTSRDQIQSKRIQQNHDAHEGVTTTNRISLPGMVMVSIGSETHSAAQKVFECDFVQSEEFTISGIVETIKKVAAAKVDVK